MLESSSVYEHHLDGVFGPSSSRGLIVAEFASKDRNFATDITM